MRVDSTGYTGRASRYLIAENIAWGSSHLATPRSVVARWLQSPAHKRNILDAGYREVGVGVAAGPTAYLPRAAFYATDFGRRYARRGSG